jgi:hypothetical protein
MSADPDLTTRKAVAQELSSSVSSKRGKVAVLQQYVDTYTGEAIDAKGKIGGTVGQVDHVLEVQVVATALMHAWRGRVPHRVMLFKLAKEGLNPKDHSNYVVTRSDVNNSKGKLFTSWLSKAGVVQLAAHPIGLASEELASSGRVCAPFLASIATAVELCGPVVVDYYQEHGLKGWVGPSGATLAAATQALWDAFALGDILDAGTNKRTTRACAIRSRLTLAGHKAPKAGGASAGAGAGAGAGIEMPSRCPETALRVRARAPEPAPAPVPSHAPVVPSNLLKPKALTCVVERARDEARAVQEVRMRSAAASIASRTKHAPAAKRKPTP